MFRTPKHFCFPVAMPTTIERNYNEKIQLKVR